ncbi:MAG: CocE/NonD family hydrolase [Nevskiaceae bacterium]
MATRIGPRSRREFIATVGSQAAIGGWYRPIWGSDKVWVPPATRRPQVIENEWIPMPDGMRLAARIVLPEDAASRPVGAVLEYVAYGKRMGTRRGDDATAAWLVPRGFALVRVDVRGSGESEGLLRDEYDLPEQADAAPIIRWISQQPWCNGKVGMRGWSYGAFTALQAAAKRIPELVAIVPAVGTENGYIDDVHLMNGCVINDQVVWGAIWKATMIKPPDPQIVGERWRSMWLERLDAQIPLVSEWLRHQLIDDYWRSRILLDYSKIQCAVYANGGVMDSYVNAVPRLLERLSCPRKGLIGPWGHAFPERGLPGPRLDWAVEECRWWDHWLNSHDTGLMAEPMLRTYLADSAVAQSYPGDTPGRWVAEQSWPSAKTRAMRLFPSPDRSLRRSRAAAAKIEVPPHVTVGGCIPLLSPSDMAVNGPTEQSRDDALSLLFETAPLKDDLAIVGNPLLELRVEADRPIAKLAARLNEVTPDGRSWLLSYGVVNLAHSADHTTVVPIEPGVPRDAQITFNYVSRRLHKGSRIRISISQAQWPIMWPSPEAVKLALLLGGTALVLPVRPRPATEAFMPIPVIRDAKGGQQVELGAKPVEIAIDGPPQTRRVRLRTALTPSANRMKDIDLLNYGNAVAFDASMTEGEVNSYRMRLTSSRTVERPDWKVTVAADATMTSTPTHFIGDEGIEASLNDEKVFARRWFNRIPREGN